MRNATKFAASGVAALLLSGCALFGTGERIKVAEVGRSEACAAPSAEMSVQLFSNADAVLAWQQGSGVELISHYSMLPGVFALIQLGQRSSGGWGLLIGPQGVASEGVVRLYATLFAPSEQDLVSSPAPTSPCVLVRLPNADWRRVEIYDQAGTRLLRAATR